MNVTEFVQGKQVKDIWGVGYHYRSLYDFLTLYKQYKRVSPCYKSAFLQDREYDTESLITTCEHYDFDSMVTDVNYKKIVHMIDKHKQELLSIYSKKYLEMNRISY